jgi:hypothetical protein
LKTNRCFVQIKVATCCRCTCFRSVLFYKYKCFSCAKTNNRNMVSKYKRCLAKTNKVCKYRCFRRFLICVANNEVWQIQMCYVRFSMFCKKCFRNEKRFANTICTSKILSLGHNRFLQVEMQDLKVFQKEGKNLFF